MPEFTAYASSVALTTLFPLMNLFFSIILLFLLGEDQQPGLASDVDVGFTAHQSAINAAVATWALAFGGFLFTLGIVGSNTIRASYGAQPGYAFTNFWLAFSFLLFTIHTFQEIYLFLFDRQKVPENTWSTISRNEWQRVGSVTFLSFFAVTVWFVLPLYLCGVGSLSLMASTKAPTIDSSDRSTAVRVRGRA